MTQIRYTREGDVLLIELSEEPLHHAARAGPTIAHLSEDGHLVRIDILNAKEFTLAALAAILHESEVVMP